MGWGSAGAKFFDPVARALREAGASDDLKTRVPPELDSLQDFLDDPVIVRAFAKNGVTWD